jgi:hypothetical protein
MANPWGYLTWSLGEFGTGLQNVNVIPTSNLLQSNISSVSVNGEINSGWGRNTWGSQAWGINGTLILSGQELTTSLNSVTALAVTFAPVTIPEVLGMDLGDPYISLDAEAAVVGEQITTFIGDVDVSPDVSITGITANLTLNSVNASNAQGWGRLTWGSLPWGVDVSDLAVQLTGVEGHVDVGSVDINADGNQSVNTGVFAEAVTEGFATITADANAFPTSQILNLSLDSVSIIGTGNVSLTGQNLTTVLNDVDVSPDADVTGQTLTTALGIAQSAISTDAYPTAQSLSLSLNSVSIDLNQQVNVTGQSIISSLNSVSILGNTIASPTGISLTGSVGQVYVTAWQIVDTGQNINWTPVDTAA